MNGSKTGPLTRVVGLLALGMSGACILGGGGSRAIDPLELPSAAELAAIVEGEVGVLPGSERAGVRVDRWAMLEPLPDRIDDGPPSSSAASPSSGDSLGEELTHRLGAGAGQRPSRAMRCVARELGRFRLIHDGHPTAPLRQFIVHRCGVTATNVSTRYRVWAAGEGGPSADALAKALAFEAGGPVGVWVGGDERRSVAVAVLGDEQRGLELEPMAMTVTGDHVELRGRVGPHEWIAGAVTRGEYGVGACRTLDATNDGATRGSFHIVCPTQASDHGAFVDISVADPGRWLGYAAARVWVSPDGSLPHEFVDPAWSRTPAPIAPDEDLVAVSLETINGLRAHLDAAPLVLERAQSDTFDVMRPYYRAAGELGDGKRQDTIAMGLYAGWDLSTRVVSASFRVMRFESVVDRRHVLEAILLSPSARLALLDPEVGLLALSVEPGAPGETEWAYFGSWVPAPSVAHQPDDEEWLFDLVDVARARGGLPDMYRIGGQVHDLLESAGDEVAAGRFNHKRGLSVALDDIVESQGVPIWGLVYLTQDVRTIEAPKQLLRNDVVQMAVHVQQVAVPNSNWARTLVYIAYVYDGDLPANKG